MEIMEITLIRKYKGASTKFITVKWLIFLGTWLFRFLLWKILEGAWLVTKMTFVDHCKFRIVIRHIMKTNNPFKSTKEIITILFKLLEYLTKNFFTI